jgi:hypothetical protein
MDDLMKILLADEKKISLLTVRYNELKHNMVNETSTDKATRMHLGLNIAAIKKSNSVIVSHFLDEHKLSAAEIARITVAHSTINP